MHSDSEMVNLRDVIEALIYMTDEDSDGVEEVMQLPTIDIVRCGECRWGKPYSDKQLKCDALGLGGLKFPDDFCSYGERDLSEIPTGSEKPNNSTVSKMEQVDEPQTERSSE